MSNTIVLTQTAELLETVTLEPTDEQLAAEILSGHPSLFAIIYRRYFPRAFRLAFSVSGNRDQADDLTQEIFLRVYKGLSGYNGESSFSTWFYRIALNHCLNYCRRERWRRYWIPSEDGHLTEISESNSESDLLEREIQFQVRLALRSLKPQARVMIILKDIEGFTYQEIADRLECSPGTVASTVSRARKLLGQKLKVLKGKV